MKLISINIELNRHYDTVLNFLKKERPDVICLQEFLESDFIRFRKELNFQGVFKAFSYINHPHHMSVKGQKYGVAIFALNIIDSGSFFYFGTEEKVLKPFNEFLSTHNNQQDCVLLWVDVKDKRDQVFRFSTTHIPVTQKGISSPFQLEVVDSLLRKLETFPEFILCGDMNAPRGKESFRRLAEKYKDNIPLKYKTSIDQNLHRVKGIMFMVDGLFTTPSYIVSNVKLLDGISDHMAIIADIAKVN